MDSNVVPINDQNFQSEVIDYKGFVLVDFWAEWCAPCKSLMPRIEQLARDRNEKIKVCKFNIDYGIEIPSEYKIQSIPTLIIFKDGKEVTRKIGVISNLQDWLDDEIN
ncbi:MAG: thioredoxin [Wolbachia endosymbiont of Meromenopon meropis]|nr:thioredoxin [Wolbachia endosymbiont of Meromenopon meropis]